VQQRFQRSDERQCSVIGEVEVGVNGIEVFRDLGMRLVGQRLVSGGSLIDSRESIAVVGQGSDKTPRHSMALNARRNRLEVYCPNLYQSLYLVADKDIARDRSVAIGSAVFARHLSPGEENQRPTEASTLRPTRSTPWIGQLRWRHRPRDGQ
jgi:hypothetical protein